MDRYIPHRRSIPLTGTPFLCSCKTIPAHTILIPDGTTRKQDARVMKPCSKCGQPAGMKCSRCRAVRYCCRACQTSDWPAHKAACSRAAAAAAALATGPAEWALLDNGEDPPPRVKRYLEKVAAAKTEDDLRAVNAEAGVSTDLPDGTFRGCAPPGHPRPSLWACMPCLRCAQDVRMRRPTREGAELQGVFCSDKCALDFCMDEAVPLCPSGLAPRVRGPDSR